MTSSGSASGHERLRRDPQQDAGLRAERPLGLQQCSQIGILEGLDALDRGGDRPGAQDAAQVVAGLLAGPCAHQPQHGVQAIGELVALGPQRLGHGRDRLQLPAHGEDLRLVLQRDHSPHLHRSAAHGHRGDQQDAIAHAVPPAHGAQIPGMGGVDGPMRAPGDRLGDRPVLLRPPEHAACARIGQRHGPGGREAEHAVVEPLEHGLLVAGHVRELLGAHAQGRPLEPPHQRQGDRSADAQGRSGHESRREDLAADVGALHRGADPHETRPTTLPSSSLE